MSLQHFTRWTCNKCPDDSPTKIVDKPGLYGLPKGWIYYHVAIGSPLEHACAECVRKDKEEKKKIFEELAAKRVAEAK